MRVLTYISDNDLHDVKYIIKNHFALSSALLTKLKLSDGIKVNNVVVSVRHKLRVGDVLKLEIPVEKSDIPPTPGNVEILYDDEDILCVSKPCGMPTHPSQNHHTDTLANIVTHMFLGTDFTFHAINRLDSYTSGVVVIAKNSYSASMLSGKLQNLISDKCYTALCNGIFKEKEGTVKAPIGREAGSTIKRCVSSNGRYAETHYRVIEELDGKSIVELHPVTGRTHQIRVHMAYIGHSLYNDFLYDPSADGTSPFLLHCTSLSLIHPHTKEKLIIKAKCISDFRFLP